MNVLRRLALGLALCVVMQIGGGLATGAHAYQAPQSWFAGFYECNVSGGNCHFTATDPVNLVVYKADGGATAALLDGMNTGNNKWTGTSCYNSGVRFYMSGYKPPNGVESTDNSNNGCGSAERDHFRYWTIDDKTVYIAASYEYPGCLVHCLSSDAFNRGRDTLANDLRNGFGPDGHSYAWTNTYYGSGYLQNIYYDGQVDVFTIGSPRSNANGLYVSAELGYTGGNQGMLRARGSQVGPWEKFSLYYLGDGTWTMQSQANGLYVSTEIGYTGGNYGMLRARSSQIGPWELYYVIPTGGDSFALQSYANNNYVSAELGYTGGNYGMLRARATQIGPWEQFHVAP